jgi:hypothetical protein
MYTAKKINCVATQGLHLLFVVFISFIKAKACVISLSAVFVRMSMYLVEISLVKF